MEIQLIEPSTYQESGKLLKPKELFFPSLTLPSLSALTPDDIHVSIANDHFEDIDFDKKVDLVGITSYTSHILRAYEIADEFRKKNVPVVMGGIHVSMEPREAMEHADTIIVGEAEETWPRFINDFRNGIRKKIYAAEKRPALNNLPVPRYSLIDKSRYAAFRKDGLYGFFPTPMTPVQTARGCPYACDFCCVTLFSGGQYRTRPIADVVNEIKVLESRNCFFVDDNIFAKPHRAKELFRALIPLKIMWIGQGSINAAKDRELIRLARKSGCLLMLVGLESICRTSIESVGKAINRVDEYEKNLKVYREQGISVAASMMFGLDGEESTIFKETYEFLVRNRVPYTVWWPLHTYPGTPLHKKLKEHGRLKEDKWWLDRKLAGKLLHLRHKGMKMEEEAFYNNYSYYYKRFYSSGSILKRMLLPPQERFLLKIYFNFVLKRKLSPIESVISS